MELLKSLDRQGTDMVTEDVLKGTRDLTEEEVEPYLVTLGVKADLDRLRDVLEAAKDAHDEHDPEIDATVAPELHQILELSRREAADLGMWQYLALVHFPGFVRYRWKYESKEAMQEKFLGEGPTNIYSQALHRLWWMAELTHDETTGDYSLTQKVLKYQSLANKVFDRWFSRYKPAAVACCEVLLEVDANMELVEKTTLRFRQALSQLQVESLSYDEAKGLVQKIVEVAEAETGSTG